MKLYEIEQQISELLNNAKVNEETGEVVIDFEKLQSLTMAKEEKIENVIKYYLDLTGDIDKFASEIKSLTAKKKTLTNKQDSIKRWLDSLHQGTKAEYGTHSISYRKSKKVVGEDVELLPEECIKVEKTAVATEVKKLLEAGVEIEGWQIVENQNIQIK
jgi:hypothetical protein